MFSNLPSLSSYSYPANKTLDGWYIKNSDGSFGEAVNKDTDFSSLDEVTLIAKWRDYQYIIKYSLKYMADQPAAFGQNVKLNKCTFTREGYDFAGWTTSSWDSTVTHQDGAIINRKWDSWYNEDEEKYDLYAVWTQNVFGKAVEAIQNKLPANNIIRAETTLPTSDTGYTIAYTSESALISSDGKITLPESGTAEITVTATITDTATQKTYTKEYTLTLYSAEAAQTETDLKTAADKLGNTIAFSYDADRNAITVLEKKLIAAKCEGVVVSVKEKTEDSGHYSSIEKDGTINFYFDPSMSSTGSHFYMTFILSKNGASVEKQLYVNIDWDKEKALKTLENAVETLTVQDKATSDMKLPKHPVKEGASSIDYDYGTGLNTWATITWSSSDTNVLTIGSAPYYPYYSPYPVTLKNVSEDTTVVLTATVTCNSVDGVAVTRTFDCTVPGGTSTGVDYQAKLDNALSGVGLKDFVTGEKLTADANGVYTTSNDIQFPTTRDLKIDGNRRDRSADHAEQRACLGLPPAARRERENRHPDGEYPRPSERRGPRLRQYARAGGKDLYHCCGAPDEEGGRRGACADGGGQGALLGRHQKRKYRGRGCDRRPCAIC